MRGWGLRYQSGPGFSEMLPFEGLQSMRLYLDKPPQRLYFEDGFSKLAALTTVELNQSEADSYFRPTQCVHILPAFKTCHAALFCNNLDRC